jgi:acetylornithine deacetylase/succinyl-diaminopimelate desuccinylase-like protein
MLRPRGYQPVALTVSIHREDPSVTSSAVDFLELNSGRSLEGLKDFLRIPSVSTNPERREDVRRGAAFVADALREAGLPRVEIFETPGHPIVYAEDLRADGPTLLVYGHYDVQPEEPVELWTSAPFDPTVRDGELYARGSVDDKGQVWMHIKVLEAYLRTAGRLPCKVKVVIEGEEESGGGNLTAFVESHRELLRSRAVVVSDSPMLARGVPSLCYGLRGICYLEIHVRGASSDLHSGSFGGAVANPAQALASILSGLKDDRQRVAIPGFYDRVRALTPTERDAFARLPFDEKAYQEQLGVPELVGEDGFSTLERVWGRPTLEINGMLSGFTGEGTKTVLPSWAMAKVSMRLVPDQDPAEIDRLFTARVESLAPRGVTVEVRHHHGGRPFLTDPDDPAMHAAARALERGFGKKPVLIREGGSVPVAVDFGQTLGLPVVLMGFGTPDENAHAPDEHLSLENFYGGMRAIAYFLEEFGRLPG